MADPYVGAARAALGQGLGLGWGDEAEAWLRAKSGEGSYEDNLRKIRQEYAQYSKESPWTSGALEFAGGAAPSVGAMFVPGLQPFGAAKGFGALARLAALGGVTGATAGAGSAEGDRTAGAVSGAVLGTALGATAPVVMKAVGAGGRALAERFRPTEARVTDRALTKLASALEQENLTPQQIERVMAGDRAMGVPSVLANVSPATVDLAEAVAQRTGAGARNIEKALVEQKLGSRERTYGQVQQALQPGDYYDDALKLAEDLRTKATPYYDAAYAHGEVLDPEVLKFLELPQFKQGLKKAEELLAAEGREIDMTRPTVEVLDQVKRGLDSLIEAQTDDLTGKKTSLGRVYVNTKNQFLEALDNAVPKYGEARAVYRGDAELLDAMRSGLKDFGSMSHEQIIKHVGSMSGAEREAFRTGVARDLYAKVMNPSGNFNAAQRIIGSPEMQAKLQPLFDNPGQFNLFKNALERESQLFFQANKVLGGSQTGKRMQMREELEASPGVGDALRDAVTGGVWNSLSNMTMRAVRNSKMPEKTAEKLSTMLMSKDPHEVAAVVKLLEEQAASSAPKALRATAGQAGVITGTTAAGWPTPTPEMYETAPAPQEE